jgi:hypothetical protein
MMTHPALPVVISMTMTARSEEERPLRRKRSHVRSEDEHSEHIAHD